MEKVLVTGATGYIGLHCIHQLLNQGYAVNGSVRSPERKNEIFEALKNHNTPTENLNIFVFDLNDDEGWDEGILGMQVGGIRELIIPPHLGYGNQAIYPIPANSILTFEVQLISIRKSSSNNNQD